MVTLPVIAELDFRLMIHVHVPHYFMENNLCLLGIVNLGIEITHFDVNILHHFPDEFVPLVILPPLSEETQINVLVEGDSKMIFEKKE